MAKNLIKQTLDEWLDSVDYKVLNSSEYVPSSFALAFATFVKMVNGAQGESHVTPPVHLKMLDKVAEPTDYIANLCFRGAAKTTLFMEYFCLFCAVFTFLPGLGELDSMIYVSDSMENGVASARKNIQFRYENSEWLKTWLPKAKFTDKYIEFENRDGKKFGIKMFGAKALSLDSKLFLATGGTITMGNCQVGDVIMGADGKPTKIVRKSEVFHKPMYELVLQDGRKLKVSEDHLNQIHVKKFKSEKTFSSYSLEEKTLSTLELLGEQMFATDPKGSKRPLLWVENAKPMEWQENRDVLLDPYTVGVLLGDGSMNGKATGQVPVVLTAHESDWSTYEKEIPYELGKAWVDPRNPSTISRTIKDINNFVSVHGLSSHGRDKKVPESFLYSSIEQRLAVLQGLMDTDGTCSKDGKSSFCSASKSLVESVMWLVRSLGGEARWIDKGNNRAFQCSVRLNMPLFRLARKLERQRPLRNDKMAIIAINRIADEPSQCIAVDNEERQFVAEDFFRTHNTGLRGTKIFGKRPRLAVLDDLVSDDDARSETAMGSIKDTVYKGVNHALDPTSRKVIFNGTPFNSTDILIEAVESGAWDVNVWPVCERFPCSKEEFVGAWESRFSYEYVKAQYEMAVKTGKLAAFYQELMLRITSEDERLVQDKEIRWYKRNELIPRKGDYNFYITTDFATSDKQTADFNVISVWAMNSNSDYFWVDGICDRMTIDKAFNHLFRLVQAYKPMSVGIEITGQQQAYIKLLQGEMMHRNIWFNFASSEKSGEPGIRPVQNKLSRFNLVVPWFKAGKIYWPEELNESVTIGRFMGQIRLATINGLKGKDDCIDTISMLGMFKQFPPGESQAIQHTDDHGMWNDPTPEEPSALSSYIV